MTRFILFVVRNIRNDKVYIYKNFLYSNLRWLVLFDSKLLMIYFGIKVESFENIDGVGIFGDIVIYYLVYFI